MDRQTLHISYDPLQPYKLISGTSLDGRTVVVLHDILELLRRLDVHNHFFLSRIDMLGAPV